MTNCWCGKELGTKLVWVEGLAKSVQACLIHGADCVWRVCPEYAVGEPRTIGMTNEVMRDCRLPLHMGPVRPYICAACPVPEQKRKSDLWDACGENLVLAVRAAGRLLNALGGIGFNEMLEQYNPPGWSLCVANLVQAECLVAKADAALALLPEKEGDEHG